MHVYNIEGEIDANEKNTKCYVHTTNQRINIKHIMSIHIKHYHIIYHIRRIRKDNTVKPR